ncbi:MAG TPA: DUF2059 domain-containing protein [Candidatus Dormibacteraeota bacterium]|nr:DUF2059 domain-containing protein [Candidatus Dormibacteraeota bacterium]
MKKILVVVALCLVCVAPCLAQESQDNQPASAADIERYVEVMHIRDQMKDMMTAMSAQMRQIMHEQLQKTPNLPPGAQQQMDKMYDAMLQKLPTEEILQAMVPVYQKYLTKDDVNSLIAFYSTPTGQKVLAEMPQITKDGIQAESGIMRQYMDEAMKEAQAQITQMQKNQEAQRKNATSKD